MLWSSVEICFCFAFVDHEIVFYNCFVKWKLVLQLNIRNKIKPNSTNLFFVLFLLTCFLSRTSVNWDWVMSMSMSTYIKFIYGVSWGKQIFVFVDLFFVVENKWVTGSGHGSCQCQCQLKLWSSGEEKKICFLFLFCWHVVMLTSGSSLVFGQQRSLFVLSLFLFFEDTPPPTVQSHSQLWLCKNNKIFVAQLHSSAHLHNPGWTTNHDWLMKSFYKKEKQNKGTFLL